MVQWGLLYPKSLQLSPVTTALQSTTFGWLPRHSSHCLPIPAIPVCSQAAEQVNARAGAYHIPFPSSSLQTPSPTQPQPLS